MSGLIRKVVIFAALDGLILQSHGSIEHNKLLHISYKTRVLTSSSDLQLKKDNDFARLETHGIIGLLSLFSHSFLIAITGREQVAQLFGKPIYVITNVAILPLVSQRDAAQAIREAATSQATNVTDDSESDSDEPSHAKNGSVSEEQVADDPPDPPTLQRGDDQNHQSPSRSRIAEDVFAKRGQYGAFASQWFSRRGWSVGAKAQDQPGAGVESAGGDLPGSDNIPPTIAGDKIAQDTSASTVERNQPEVGAKGQEQSSEQASSATAFLPKILRQTRVILSSGSFFFSHEYNITRSIGSGTSDSIQESSLNSIFYWNFKLGEDFSRDSYQMFLTPVMQGFVGQRSFTVKYNRKERSHSVVPQPLELAEGQATGGEPGTTGVPPDIASASTQSFLLTVISRRSNKRSGLRYLRRGVDDDGNCANFVETEQILNSEPFDKANKIRSFVQIRGSIPLYFSQTPYSFKPVPKLYQSEATNQKAFKKHFAQLQERYGNVQIVTLIDKHGGELAIGEEYEKVTKLANESGDIRPVHFKWFDFHSECRGMKFENVERLVNALDNDIEAHSETIVTMNRVTKKQKGVVRTNCMDCLDRTNVAQSAFAQHVLQRDLQDMGFDIDLVHDETTTWFNSLWADNGDAISRAYAGSSALKGDYTRTRKRNYRGALNDFGLTLTRYYNNIVNDYFAQAVIDVLLGNLSAQVFEDFETNMMSADPGISIASVREAAVETCSKIVIQDSSEDLIHGWTMLSPAQPNTLRSHPLEEMVVLLTDAAVYCCRFDWITEKVSSFEKIDLRSITKIKFGTYITSILSDRLMDEQLNAGMLISYNADKDSTVRVNTRSLQSTVPERRAIDGGTGVLSWLGSKPVLSPARFVALKIVPQTTEEQFKSIETPMGTAEHISYELQRAALVGITQGVQEGEGMVEKGAIISLEEAKLKTSYIEQVTHSIKKLVWT